MPRKKINQDEQTLPSTPVMETENQDTVFPIPEQETPPVQAAVKKATKKATTKGVPETEPDSTETDETTSWPPEDTDQIPFPAVEAPPEDQGGMAEPLPEPRRRQKSERQQFFDLRFSELDRYLTNEERAEWNSIYASYRGRSAMSGTIIGVDQLSVNVKDSEVGTMERKTMYCAIVVPYRVRIVIPAPEMWEKGQERPDFVLQNMVGANIDFIITKVDRESGFAIASRRLASQARQYYFDRRPALHGVGARTMCKVMAVGPRRCLVECYGHDINLTQRELRYTAIPDLREVYHPGQELPCIVMGYDANKGLTISVKETESNPFDGAELRHPAGSRRQATIAGKYGGGVFCNLPDGTVCMCNYAYQYQDADFKVGDTVILAIQRFDMDKKQMYGKILTKW
ncbi:MAG: hypothetical protein HFF06_03915 [Oscillospiraceae bacterium]|jgi:hypothetical protein|nr:hypothetical protein [Oscillospiraceae bacterium]